MHRPIAETSRREDGFTLVELIVVVIIIGILAAVAVPLYSAQQRSARDTSVISDVRNTSATAAQWVLNHDRTAITNTTDYADAGGELTRSGENVIDVTASGTGEYTVCGYTAKGDKYNANTSAYLLRSATGQGTRSTAGCPGHGVESTPTPGTTSPGGSIPGGTTPGAPAPSVPDPGTRTTSTPTSTAPASSAPTPTASTPAPTASTPAPTASTPAPTASTPAPTASTPAPEEWIDCAQEGGTCAFTGSRSVRYGIAPSAYVIKTIVDGTPCTNAVFGDPANGYVKRCAYLK